MWGREVGAAGNWVGKRLGVGEPVKETRTYSVFITLTLSLSPCVNGTGGGGSEGVFLRK